MGFQGRQYKSPLQGCKFVDLPTNPSSSTVPSQHKHSVTPQAGGPFVTPHIEQMSKLRWARKTRQINSVLTVGFIWSDLDGGPWVGVGGGGGVRMQGQRHLQGIGGMTVKGGGGYRGSG